MSPKDTNLSLNDDDLRFLSDREIFLKKRQLSDHIIDILGDIEAHIQQTAVDYVHKIPESAFQKRGKISRGENYLGFPWFILDHPATFQKDQLFAFRTLVWWGNYFSVTFHISGFVYDKMDVREFIFQLRKTFPELLVCSNENQWEHFLERPNFVPAEEFLQEIKLTHDRRQTFLKTAIKIPFEESETLKSKVLLFVRTVLDLY